MTTQEAVATILPILLTALATPIAAILSGLLWKLWTLADANASAKDKSNMEEQIHSALSVGISQALPILLAKGGNSKEAREAVLKIAVDYFQQRFPDRSATITDAAGGKVKSLSDTNSAVTETLEGRLISSLKATFPAPAAAAPTQPRSITPAPANAVVAQQDDNTG